MRDSEINRLLTEEGVKAVTALRESMVRKDRNASGDTSRSIESVVQGNRLIILGPEHMIALEEGRKPTESDGPPGKDQGFFDKIVKWMADRGIQGSASAIYAKINKEGYEGTPGLVSDPANQIIESVRINTQDTLFLSVLSNIRNINKKQ